MIGALLIAALAWWLSSRETEDGNTTVDIEAPIGSPSTASTAPSASLIETERVVTVDGAVVTVEETSRVMDGATSRAVPPTSAPPGLRLVDARVVTATGRVTAFNSPVTLQRSGSLTVSARYRLTDCPDVLPAVWPSPTQFPGASQSYSRLDQPLHTAYAICPKEPYRSSRTSGIAGELLPGEAGELGEFVRIRLSWDGGDTLSVSGIGSASGVAAIPVQGAAACGSDSSCLAILDAVLDAGQTSTATFTMQPVDPCPPQTTDDRLVLLVAGGSLPPEPTTIAVPGLHRAVCQQ